MKPVLQFNIRNQNISRVDNFLPVRYSRDYLYAEFDFKTQDWDGKNKTAVFESSTGKRITVMLGETNTCIVPWEMLEGVHFDVSVFGGNLITTDTATVKLYESGYREEDTQEPTPGAYDQIITKLNEKADAISFEGEKVILYSGEKVIYEKEIEIDGGSFKNW